MSRSVLLLSTSFMLSLDPESSNKASKRGFLECSSISSRPSMTIKIDPDELKRSRAIFRMSMLLESFERLDLISSRSVDFRASSLMAAWNSIEVKTSRIRPRLWSS